MKLNQIYNIVERSYSKRKNVVQTTINCLDYTNIYLKVRYRIDALDELITEIDNYISVEEI